MLLTCHGRQPTSISLDIHYLNIKIMTMKKNVTTSNSLIAGATVLAPIAWGTTYVTVTQLLPDDRPLLVATMRVIPAGVVLLIVGGFVSRWRPRGGGVVDDNEARRLQLRSLLPAAQCRRLPPTWRCSRRRRGTAAAAWWCCCHDCCPIADRAGASWLSAASPRRESRSSRSTPAPGSTQSDCWRRSARTSRSLSVSC